MALYIHYIEERMKSMKKVLFSPVGTTDPITNLRDGALLHICRKYQPDIIYLYLSKEMCEFHDRDNRYEYCLNKLGELLNWKFEVRYKMKPDLVDVQKFDFFIREYKEQIREIMEEEPDCELLLNISSGTPAMKSALQTLSVFAEYPVTTIQVSTPRKAYNKRQEDKENYDVEENWELNEDNDKAMFEDRCVESEKINLLTQIKKKMIEKHIHSYDYVAAKLIAEEIKTEIHPDLIQFLDAMDARLQLNLKKMDQLEREKKLQINLKPDVGNRNLYEYILRLQIKLKKHEYTDFLCGLTPVIAELFEKVLERECHIKVDDYCQIPKKNSGERRWDLKKMQENEKLYTILNEEFKGGFRECPVYSSSIEKLIQRLCADQSLKTLVGRLRSVEEKARNRAAHVVVSVTEEWIKKETGENPETIMNMIKKLTNRTDMKIKEEMWSDYDRVNEQLVKVLEFN